MREFPGKSLRKCSAYSMTRTDTERLVIMLIFSRDRKKVQDCVSIAVQKVFGGGKEQKYALIGSSGFGTTYDGVLAYYADEKTAMDDLEKLFAAFEGGAASYRM